jgi:hypothetical protein
MGSIVNFLQGVDWTATGILAISVWQAVKEWRTRAVTKPAKPKPATLPKRPPSIPPLSR